MSRFDGLRTKETVESSKFAGLRTMPLNDYYSSAKLSNPTLCLMILSVVFNMRVSSIV